MGYLILKVGEVVFNWLLEIRDSGVVSDIISGDNKPGGVVNGINIDNASLIFGIFIGLTIAFFLWGLVKLIKMLISDYKNKKNNNNESDE